MKNMCFESAEVEALTVAVWTQHVVGVKGKDDFPHRDLSHPAAERGVLRLPVSLDAQTNFSKSAALELQQRTPGRWREGHTEISTILQWVRLHAHD